MSVRVEKDLLGEREVPATAYWGIHTLRAQENFSVTGTSIGASPDLIRALAHVKQAAARANHRLGLLDERRRDAIVAACERIDAGEFHDQFVVDMVQGGAGTSTNMNANEVIANVALEELGAARGEYATLHPNDHVNMGQSTNDVYPTAVKLALVSASDRLAASLRHLELAFGRKGVEFATIVKMGRTQLQDAVPMTLGQEFAAYAVTIGEDQARLREQLVFLHEVNLGATAIGTGITAPSGYAEAVRAELSEVLGREVVTAPDLVEATQDCGVFVSLSGMLRRIAVKLSKISNDLRLLSSGPRAGLAEISLPPRQAGSSIMPGKVNPVIPELVNQIAFEVMGNDVTVMVAAESGQLQLNAFEPIIAFSLLKSITHLDAACRHLADLCVDGITADAPRLRAQVLASAGLGTVLVPHVGYAAATAVVQEALRSGRTVADVVLEAGLLKPESLATILMPESLANLPLARVCRTDQMVELLGD